MLTLASGCGLPLIAAALRNEMAPSVPDSSRNTMLAISASAGLLAGFLICRAQAGGEVRRLLHGNWAVLSHQDRATAACLVASGRGNLLRNWPQPGASACESDTMNVERHTFARGLGEHQNLTTPTLIRCLETSSECPSAACSR